MRKSRVKNEKLWKNENIHDPKYSKYVKEDMMNNRMMERLNSEIDFRLDDGKMKIEKPFDDNNKEDITDTFAKFESLDRKTFIPKRRKNSRRYE